jgi:hypothetical protein
VRRCAAWCAHFTSLLKGKGDQTAPASVHSHLYNVNAAFEQNERFITILKDTEVPAVT